MPTTATDIAQNRPLLMSLRPRFAHAILDGSKTVELRRTRVSVPPGTTIIIYASSPIMAVLGTAVLVEVDTARPNTLWRRHSDHLGLTRAEFNDYLIGAATASCLTLYSPRTLPASLPLTELREHAEFQPPQSYRYLAAHDPAPLHEIVAPHRLNSLV